MPTPRRYATDEERKAAQRLQAAVYQKSGKGQTVRKRYRQSEKGREAQRRWDASEAGRAKQTRYRGTEKRRLVRAKHRQTEGFRVAQATRMARTPEQVTARTAVSNALKAGRLVRPTTCSRCGGPRPQAHHHMGYAREHRLAVEWLCPKCHAAAHGVPK